MNQPALEQWRDQLHGWAIPPQILAQAPQSPWIHPVAQFRAAPGPAPATPSRDRARAGLPPQGTVLDVGCGGGRAAFALAPPAGRVIGVDHQGDMLTAFAQAAQDRGLQHQVIQGDWPQVEAQTPIADVVTCHHVAYNVADLATFAQALNAHARQRVVMELPLQHPLTGLAPLWLKFWNLERPAGPTAELALQVLREAGLPAQLEVWTEPQAPPRLSPAEHARATRIRLCLPESAEPAVAEALAERPEPQTRQLATLWWDATSS